MVRGTRASATSKKPAEEEDTMEVENVDDVEEEEEELEEIELSSDEEDDDADVALVVMKRPPQSTKMVDMLELGDDEDEGPMVEGAEKGSVNIQEKEGFVKEYIETEGLGVIFSRDIGLVLFHLENVWVDGKQLPPSKTKESLEVGAEVHFYDQSFEGEEYKELSHDGVIHQAVAVWTGDDRPDHLLKKVAEAEYKSKLEENRKSFMLYLRGEVFLRAALVRVKGELAGYLSENIGIVDYKDEKDDTHHIFFHVDDVKLFKKDLKDYKKSAKQLMPVGITLSVDARRVHISGVKGIEYQAVSVIVGGWPTTPHPTLLPGGQGSEAPSYEIPDDATYTFYYLELALEAKLQKKVNQLKEVMGKSKGEIKYDWKNTETISDGKEAMRWREQFTGRRKKHGDREQGQHKKEVFHAFRAAPESDLKEECLKKEGRDKVTQKAVIERTWYSSEAWEHGGLKIKNEVKAEDGSPTKKLKKEM